MSSLKWAAACVASVLLASPALADVATFEPGVGEVVGTSWFEAGGEFTTKSNVDGTFVADTTGGALQVLGNSRAYLLTPGPYGHLFSFDILSAGSLLLFLSDPLEGGGVQSTSYSLGAGTHTIDLTQDFGPAGFYTHGQAFLVAFEGSDFAVDNVVFDAVPEPAAWALMIAGFGLAGAAVRQRRALA